jgi:hypothetical protein
MKKLIFVFVLLASIINAQTKTASLKNKKTPPVVADTLIKDTIVVKNVEVKVPRKFMVYTKKVASQINGKKKERLKLCINLVSADSVLNYCINDSICFNPEVFKILFEQKVGDTAFVLVYVDAFTKPTGDDPKCAAGHETKLFFARWNTKTNSAKWKQKNICSCSKGIINMTKEPISDWDKSVPLLVNYYRGGDDFIDLTFDPAHPELGLQTKGDSGGEGK